MGNTTALRWLSTAIIASALIAVVASHLWITGALPAFLVGSERYLTTSRHYFHVPAELGLLLAATMLLVLVARAEARTRHDIARAHGFIWSIVLLGASAGMLAVHPFTMTLWLIVVCAVAALYFSSESISPATAFRLTVDDFRGRFGSGTWVPVVILLLAIAVAGQAMSARASANPRDQASMRQLVTWYKAAKPVALEELLGADQARLAVFTDYQCPTCSAMVPLYRSVVSAARLKGHAIELTIYDFPLESECNSLIRGTTHPMACEAAAAVRLVRARAPGQLDDFESWLYAQQAALTANALTAKLAVLELENAFREQYHELVKAVRQDADLGARAGVHSTPTLFLQGVKLPSVTPRGLEALFDAVAPFRMTSSQ